MRRDSGATANAARSASLFVHEFNQVFQAISDFVIREALEKKSAVTFRTKPVVEDGENPAIRLRSDQPPQPLFQSKHRIRDLILRECAPAIFFDLFGSCGNQRIGGNLKRKLVDNYG